MDNVVVTSSATRSVSEGGTDHDFLAYASGYHVFPAFAPKSCCPTNHCVEGENSWRRRLRKPPATTTVSLLLTSRVRSERLQYIWRVGARSDLAELNYLSFKWRGSQPWQTELTVGVSWPGAYWERPRIGAAHASIEEKTLAAAMQDGTAQAGQAEKPKTDIPPGSLPCGKIGNVSLSRLFIGGNLIGGWAHSRDLMYASKLFTSYNTEAKVFETLELAQACGINTIQLDPAVLGRR